MPFTPFPDANITSLIGLMTYANTVTNNWFAILFLFILYIVSILSMYRNNVDIIVATATSSFLMIIISKLFEIAGLVKNEIVVLFIVLSLFMLFLLWRRKED